MRKFALALALMCVACATQRPSEHDTFAMDFGAFVEAVRAEGDLPPGFGVIVTDGADTVFERAYGVRDTATGAPMTLDTPIIAASISKSHVALLAVRLDAQGVLSLDATLSDVWPTLTLPALLDPRTITVSSLLSHHSGIADTWLDLRSITAGNVTLADVQPHLSRYASTTEPGFQYSNFGVYLYSMMVEQVTGRDWRAVIEDEVFRPMRLSRTTIRLTDIPQDEIAHCHARNAGDWVSLPLEAPESLNAAGGIHMSVGDASRFVQAFATDGATMPNIPAAQFGRTQQQEVVQEGDLLGFARDGYGLGWDLSDYHGDRVVSRSGGYPGCRTLIAFMPGNDVSISAFGVGDAGVNVLIFALAKYAFDLSLGRADPQASLAAYREAHAAGIARVDAIAYPNLESPLANPARMNDYVGAYASDIGGRIDIAALPSGLAASWNVFHMVLVPAEGEAFNAYVRGSAEGTPLGFERDANGRVVALIWDDARFERQ